MSYQIAKETLNATEKDRLLCIVLHWEGGKINWDAAAKDFGSASAESFRKCHQNTMKKVTTAGEKAGKRKPEDEVPEDLPATPKKTPRKSKKKAEATPSSKEVETPVQTEPEEAI